MTLAADRWPAYVEPEARDSRAVARPDSVAGALVVWRIELAKLSGMIQVRAMVAAEHHRPVPGRGVPQPAERGAR